MDMTLDRPKAFGQNLLALGSWLLALGSWLANRRFLKFFNLVFFLYKYKPDKPKNFVRKNFRVSVISRGENKRAVVEPTGDRDARPYGFDVAIRASGFSRRKFFRAARVWFFKKFSRARAFCHGRNFCHAPLVLTIVRCVWKKFSCR
jgi:hypothetical protein